MTETAVAHGVRARRGPIGILMTVPAFVLVVALLGVPIGQAVYYSMTNWDGLTTTWIGPSTYLREFSNPAFWRVLQNNALLLLAVPVAMILSLAIAYVLNLKIPGWRLFRTLIFMPTAISWVVIGMVAARVFAQQGDLNGLLRALGLGFLQTDMLAGERTALLAVAIVFVWSMVGTNMIIFLAGFATMDGSLIEAARIDGASGWVIFRSIIIPQMRRFLQFSFMITAISAFTALFSLIYVMTGGGPGYGTTTLEFFVYQTAFSQTNFGLGALLGIILFVIMALIGLMQHFVLKDSD
ncbi:MAG: sugar ABC transporter permease [Actinobacteria bacterium]|jgi:multiple sugar transport system permease protein|nr:sugar ABC transporter permease [Actinomycetota bacterium]